TGSGIYRDVTLVRKAAVFVPIWGVTVKTPKVSQDSAQIGLELDLHNSLATPVEVQLTGHITDAAGQIQAEYTSIVQLDAASKAKHTAQLEITQPSLWSPDTPHMYTAVTQVVLNGEIVDTTTTPFGMRYFHFDADQGFFLNGHNMLIKGVCLHHDAGLVGAAVPDGVWRRRLQHLKTMGCNAIRTAHNPSSAQFLDLCDELGFLVQNEFFDEWSYGKDKRLNKHDRHGDAISQGYADYFQEWAEHDLKTTILRDKNHPCIFQWGIGNEIEWTYLNYSAATGYFDAEANGNYFWTLPPYSSQDIKKRFDDLPAVAHDLTETAQQLAEWTRELDDSRPVIANCILPSASHVTGYGDALDIVGYSYRAVMYDRGHEDFPDKVIMGTENLGQWHEWKNVIDRPFISGLFFWTGIDYLGEAEAHSSWPVKATASGMLDLAGFPKPAYHMIKSLWQDAPHCQLYTQLLDESEYVLEANDVIEKHKGAWQTRLWFWHKVNKHWNYPPDELIVAEVYSNCDTVELFLNGTSLGEQRLRDQEDRIFKWAVPFAAGKLEARATNACGQTVTNHLVTAGQPHHLKLTADKLTLDADAYDVSHIIVQLCDINGNPVRHEDHRVSFELIGSCENLGVDTGSADNVQPHNADSIVTSQGHALMIVRSRFESGSVTIQARADDLAPASLTLEIR
ncbi:MAG: glycoside hydrolase family 2 TIM barrel-domain containing protein, partial [Deinococcota bacterium]